MTDKPDRIVFCDDDDGLPVFVCYIIDTSPTSVSASVYSLDSCDPDGSYSDCQLQPYLDLWIKWDGCTELVMNDVHLCGKPAWDRHIWLMSKLYPALTQYIAEYREDVAE